MWVDSVLGEEKVWVSQLAHCFFFFIFSFQFCAFWRFFPVVGGGGGGGGGECVVSLYLSVSVWCFFTFFCGGEGAGEGSGGRVGED